VTAQEWRAHAAQQIQVLDSPADVWVDGHILGNGDLGAVVWGSSERLCLGLSKHDVYDFTTPSPRGTRWPLPYPEIVKRVMAGDRQILRTLENLPDVLPHQLSPLATGVLSLEVLRGQPVVGFRQQLSLYEAECRVQITPTNFGHTWGMEYAPVMMTSFVHASRNLLVVRLHCALPQQVTWSLIRTVPHELPAPTYQVCDSAHGTLAAMDHRLPEDYGYALALGAKAAHFAASHLPQGILGSLEFGGERGDALLLLSVVSDGDAGGEVALAVAKDAVQQALCEDADQLCETHRAWWEDFWQQSAVDYDDPDITRLWYMGLYALASSTRPSTSPPNLQGIWNQYDIPPWHADFHFNVNIQEAHWGACAANHPELQHALLRMLSQDWRQEFRRFAREQFSAPGLAVPMCVDRLGRALPGWPLGVELCTTAWAAQHLWQHWRYTGDEAFLRDTAYPFLRECCEFYQALLVRDAEGQYNIELSHSPEQRWPDATGKEPYLLGRNPAIDIAFIRELFENCVQAGMLLNSEDAQLDACREILAHLPDLPVHNGVLIDYATGFFEERDRPGWLPQSHRHPSRLVPIFPCEQIGLHSEPEQLALGRRSYYEYISYGSGDIAGWSLVFRACLAARLGLADEAEQCLRLLIDEFTFPGGLSSHNTMTDPYGPLYQIEALQGAPAGVNEMLLQCTGGILRVFPALPQGRRAAFYQLRAPGGILVSAAHDGKAVTYVEVTCERDGEITLFTPYPGHEAVLQCGSTLVGRYSDEYITWHGNAGHVYRIVCSTLTAEC
jgi:hypothetical protein